MFTGGIAFLTLNLDLRMLSTRDFSQALMILMFMEDHLSAFLDISLMWTSMTEFIMFVGLTTETVFSQKISSTQAFSQVLMILLSMQERLGMFPSLECKLTLFQTTTRTQTEAPTRRPRFRTQNFSSDSEYPDWSIVDEPAPMFEERERDVLVFEPFSEDPPSYHQIWEQG